MRGATTLFFDAGNTLLRPKEDVGRVYAEAARRQGVDADPDAVMASFFRAFHAQKQKGMAQDRAWWAEVVEGTFRPFGTPRDPEALFDDLYTHFTAPASWTLYPRAVETLETLSARGYRVGLISNWDDRLPQILEGLGLAPLLDPKVISYAVGAEKPDPRIFEAALRAAAVAPEDAVMIGDDDEADVAGPKRIGMHAVQVRRPGQRVNGAPVVDRLDELLDLFPGVGR